MTETSILLGAGFSVNKGYPTAKKLNQKLTELEAEDFWVASEGTVLLKEKTQRDLNDFGTDSRQKYFVIDLIKFYQDTIKSFNYEEFYDFFNSIDPNEKNTNFDNFCNAFREEYQINTDNRNLISRTKNIFNQLISRFIVDGEGKKFYDSIHYSKPYYSGYTGFLDCLESWGNEGITHIHTLNHDVFFETLSHSDWIQGDFSDGFEEMGSKYYGGLKDNQKVRLSYFTNNYANRFRLYKLHGSFDQFPFHLEDSSIDTYVKIKMGVGTTKFYKEVDDGKGGYKYVNDWINYHSDFLSGTTSKILRYGEPLYYDKVFGNFKINLSNSNKLIIIGYGCGDSEINNMIETNFDFKKYPIILVEPYPTEQTELFIKKFNAKIIIKTPSKMDIIDCK
nr:SIR2 family protein [uncultured Flavobacterium sp.]